MDKLIISSTAPRDGEEFEIETANGYAVLTVSLTLGPMSPDGQQVQPDALTVCARLWEDGMDIEDGEAVSTVERLARVLGCDPSVVAEELRAVLKDRWAGAEERRSERALMAR